MAKIFVSPGVYTREQDFTVFASRIGITRLGLVGKTEKGPAFKSIKVSSSDEYLLRFGRSGVDYPLSYVANSFLGQADDLSICRVLGKEGFTNSNAWIIVADSGNTFSASTLAVLRSKKDSDGDDYLQSETDILIETGTTTILGDITISAMTESLTYDVFTVSLDETKENYIVKVFGKNPKKLADGTDTYPNVYVEEVYPHFIRQAYADGKMAGAIGDLVFKQSNLAADNIYWNYSDDYKNSTTPWIVSRVVGGEVNNLFKVHTISDGDASAREIKISIANIDINNYTFDVIVRRFEDTDATASSSVLERFSNLTLDDSAPNYIGKMIGTRDEEYPAKSLFITVEMSNRIPNNSVPAGFRGYNLRTDGSDAIAPEVYYKTTYFSGDSIFKTYLGISELAYTSLTMTNVTGGVKNAVKSIESDIFVYKGASTTGYTATKGFHLENTASATYFVSGDKSSMTGYTSSAGILDKSRLKFTVVPFGGFDGFDKYKSFQHPYMEFQESETNNHTQFKEAIDVFANPEETDINLFATPGVDFKNNTSIIRYALEMVEDRADSLYVIDSPRVTVITDGEQEKGTPEEVVSDLESTGLDTNYATTYWPWIQIEDQSTGKYVYQSPTMLAVRSMAFTDNTAAPWWAPAGINRATAGVNVKRTDIKLSKRDRDTLYEGRINPIASFVQQGIVIWGQKTLQIQVSALDRINIRRLLLQVRRLVSAASLTLVFEQNDQALRDQFLAQVEPILLRIQNERGLTAFRVVMDDSNNTNETVDRNMLIGKIQLKPTPTAEFIDIEFQVLPTGANFEDF